MIISKIKRAVEVIRIILITVSILLVLSAFMSCAQPARVVAPPEKQPAPGVEPKPALIGWEADWEKALSEARREGKLMLYSWYGSELSRPVMKTMKEKFGIDVEWMTMRGTEMAEKVLRERRAGLFLSDLTIHGSTTGLNQVKPAGITEPIKPELLLPEVLDPKVWMDGKLPFIDKDGHLIYVRASANTVLTINKDIVRKDEIASYRDLLHPKWKGKIVWDDPSQGGPGSMAFRVLGFKYMGLDFMREMIKQEPVFTRDRRLAVDWVAKGRYPIGVGLDTISVGQYQEAGAPLQEFNPREGGYVTSGGGNLYIFKDAPHPNARRVFINWFLTREGLTLFTQKVMEQTSREDVPTGHLDPGTIRQPGLPYFIAISEEWIKDAPKMLEVAKEVFGPLLK